MSDLTASLSQLISAYHVLHHHNTVQQTGSVSIRNPDNPSTFFTGTAPAIIIQSQDDLEERYVQDGTPCVQRHQPASRPETNEYHIHSCIYAFYPGIQAVVHSKSQSAIVYGLEGTKGSMISPLYNDAGFLDDYAPIFDPAMHYSDPELSHSQDLRVSSQTLGSAMAKLLSRKADSVNGIQNMPDYSCVLLRGNGAALCGDNLQCTVHKAVHLEQNAQIQAASMLQRNESESTVAYLDATEAEHSERSVRRMLPATWDAWVLEAERTGMYKNDLKE